MLPILLSLLTVASSIQQPQSVYVGTRGDIEVALPRLDQSADIDGSLDEAVWANAAVLTGFSQYEPVDQRPAADTTQVLVWYSPTGIYFGIRAFDASGSVNATLADRVIRSTGMITSSSCSTPSTTSGRPSSSA